MNTSVMTSTGTFEKVIDAQVRAMFDRHLEEQSSELYYGELGLVDYEPDVPEEKMADMSGPGKGVLTIENQEYGSVSKAKGYPVTLNLRKYTFDLSWTEEDIHWIKKQTSSKRASTLRNAASGAVQALYQNINEDTAKVFYLGFGTTLLSVGNSEALFGSHNLQGTGETERNDFGSGDTQRALGPTAVTTAIEKMNRFSAHNGIQLKRVRNLKLIVANENIATAHKIIFSLYGPDSANLGLSTASQAALAKRKMTIEAIEIPDILVAYKDYWFITETARASQRAYMAWGWKPRMKMDDKASRGTVSELGSTLFSPFIVGWQWAFGSQGSGAAI